MIGRKKPGVKTRRKGLAQVGRPGIRHFGGGRGRRHVPCRPCARLLRKEVPPRRSPPIVGKPEVFCHEQLMKLAVYGACFVNCIEGVDMFWTETWIPGTMEMIVNNLDNIKKFPIVGYAMEAYGRVRGPMSSGSFPVGVGLMRVIPIQSAIDGESRKASYEEISTYLEENTIFTVSPLLLPHRPRSQWARVAGISRRICASRWVTPRNTILYPHRARPADHPRGSVRNSCRRAEENGLMHEIPNTDGAGQNARHLQLLRAAGAFRCARRPCLKTWTWSRSNYVSEVDASKCVACGQCVENCPVNAAQARPEALLEKAGRQRYHHGRYPAGRGLDAGQVEPPTTAKTARTW